MELYYEKYAPKNINEIIGNDSAVKLIQSIISDSNCQNILLSGPSGCGKTTLVKNLIKTYFGEHYKQYFIEIFGSVDRSKDVVSEYKGIQKKTDTSDSIDLSRFINKTMKLPNNVFRIVVFYDFEKITTKALLSLKGIIEEKSNRVRYIFVCNSIESIIEPIQSRCIQIIMHPIEDDIIKYKLKSINSTYDEDIYNEIVYIANGDLKKALNYLHILDISNIKTIDAFKKIFNIISLNTLYKVFISDYKTSVNIIKSFFDDGFTSSDILNGLLRILMIDSFKIDHDKKIIFIESIINSIKILTESDSHIHVYSLISKFYS